MLYGIAGSARDLHHLLLYNNLGVSKLVLSIRETFGNSCAQRASANCGSQRTNSAQKNELLKKKKRIFSMESSILFFLLQIALAFC